MGQTGNYKTIFFDVNKAREIPNSIDSAIDVQLQTPSTAQVGGFDFGSLFGSKPTPAPVAAQGVPVAAQGQTALTAVKAQPQPQKQMFGGSVAEDRRMTLQAFNTLIKQMVPITGDLCPLSGQMFNPFNNQIMPDLSCPGLKINFGGRRKLKSKKLKYKKHKNRKSRRR
jgi:hypothetical protein